MDTPSSINDLGAVDELLRTGKTAAAHSKLERFPVAKLTEQNVADYARLCLRAGATELGLRTLRPWVRGTPRRPAQPTPRQKIEYAALLFRVAALDEGHFLLKSVDAKANPEAWLISASGHVTQWNYDEAQRSLQSYLTTKSLLPYQQLVARVNLAAAMVYNRQTAAAETCLADLLAAQAGQATNALQANLWQLSGVNSLLAKKWETARDSLLRAKEMVGEGPKVEGLLVNKWIAILELLQGKSPASARDHLNEVRQSAVELEHFETLRDCDRFEAIALGDTPLALKAYFGTPYRGFRQWLPVAQVPNSYMWKLGDGEIDAELDLNRARDNSKLQSLLDEPLLLKSLLTLVSDFYCAIPVATLHNRLHPGEFYDPVQSPNRIYRAMNRLRQWIKEWKLPLVIDENPQGYKLTAKRAVAIRIPLLPLRDRRESRLRQLGYLKQDEPFSARDAAELLKVSSRTLQRDLKAWIDEGKIVSCGSEGSNQYHFKR